MTAAGLPATASSRPAGWWGMALFITTEATLFGAIFSTYVYLWLRSPRWPPQGIAPTKPFYPLLLTALLVATSVPVHGAFRSARAGAAGRAVALLLLAVAVQCSYLAGQFVLFAHDLDRMPPDRSAYASTYFTMLGTHHAHVVAGIALELWFALRLTRGVNRYRLVGLHATTLYWDFVIVAGLILVALQLAPR